VGDIIQISPTYHPNITHISYHPDNFKHLWIYSQAQQNWFFTRPDVRTGLLWKITLKRAFRAQNSPFCIRGAVMGFP